MRARSRGNLDAFTRAVASAISDANDRDAVVQVRGLAEFLSGVEVVLCNALCMGAVKSALILPVSVAATTCQHALSPLAG